MKPTVVVENYRTSWVDDFNAIRDLVWPKIRDFAESIEHVGSTSVPGLSAKPIIDVDVIVNDAAQISVVVERLKEMGYEHRGNLGIEGREAFQAPANSVRQNFYVCLSGCLALRNHLILRDHLRSDPGSRREYGLLKQKLAGEFADDIDSYVEAKTNFILKILELHGVEAKNLDIIRNANLKPLRVEVASSSDVDEILTIIVELSEWLKAKGILQWGQSYPREKIESDVRSNFVYVVRERGQITATVTLTDRKDDYWTDFVGDAVYLHRLAVRRSASGKHLGSRLLAWSETKTKDQGIALLRLDCDSQNARLRRYYSVRGFEFCGLRRFEAYNMEFALFEKTMADL